MKKYITGRFGCLIYLFAILALILLGICGVVWFIFRFFPFTGAD